MDKLYYLFAATMEKAHAYRELNINEITEKAIALKHKRATTLKKATKEEIENVDIDYIALTLETLYRSTNMFPRDTQILGVLLSTINPDNHLIEEIATGQGKSIVSALHAAYLCFTGQTVDMTTSSQI